jgi:hypothetical protein
MIRQRHSPELVMNLVPKVEQLLFENVVFMMRVDKKTENKK